MNDCALLDGSGDHGVPGLGLREVRAAARIVDGRAQRARTGGGDQNNQDPQRDNQQFEAVDATHQRIAAACAQNPPSMDMFAALHDHSLIESGELSGGTAASGAGWLLVTRRRSANPSTAVMPRRPWWIWKARAISPMPCTRAPAATHATKTTTETFHDPAAQNPNPSSMSPEIDSTPPPGTALPAKAMAMSKQPRKMK